MSRKICCLLVMIFLLLCLPLGAQAAEEANILTLSGNIDGLVIDRDMVLDLNGFAVTNATVAQGVTLQLIDSANDEYDAEKCGSFAGTVNGTVEQLVQYNAKNYLVIREDGVYSAHRFYAGITQISLAPNVAGLGYKACFYADAKINPLVESYGYRLWVNDYEAKTYVKTGAIERNELTLRVNRILSEDNAELSQLGAEASISGQATITFNVNGQTLTVSGAEHTTTLQQAVELVDAALAADRSRYSDSQVTRVRDLCEKFSAYMPNWQVENIMLKFAPALPEADFLYRVGNKDSVKLEALVKSFTDKALTVSVTSNAGNAGGTYTSGSVKFSGTGLVTLTVTEEGDSVPFAMQLEIVDAYNVTAYSQLKNRSSVLLNNITMPSGGSYLLKNGTLYGNNFAFDVTAGAYNGTSSVHDNYLIRLNGGKLDNVQVVGAVYTDYGSTASADYSRALVVADNGAVIANSYLSNTASPVRVVGGSVEIVNTTLKGGNYANLDIRNGNIVLDNVTTINQVLGNDPGPDDMPVVGLGIVFNHEQVLDTTTLEIRNGLTQYNTFSYTQASTAVPSGNPQSLVNAMFNSSNSSIQYKDAQGETWVHSGILAMNDVIGPDNVIGLTGYAEKETSLLGKQGYVFTKIPTAAATTAQPEAYESAGQYAITPAYSFDFTGKNYMAKTEGSNDFCYYANGVVMISMDAGDSFAWDTSILTVTKNGQTLPYTVTMNGADYSGKAIRFDTAGEYTVTYTYTDGNNYNLNADGNLESYPVTYTKTVQLQVAVIQASAKHAEFAFGVHGSKTVTVGNSTYVMPDVSATSATIGSVTLSGTTIYCPIVEAYTSNGKTSQTSGTKWYMYFPVFKDAVTITDYANGGMGAAVVYDSSTTTMPDGLSVTNPGTTFQYSSAATAPETAVANNGVLVYTSPEMEGVNRNEMTITAKYQYTDNAGSTCYYYVKYHCQKITNSSCVTGDTLVTLADGTQKQIKDVTYSDQLKVWDFYKGEYAVVPAAIIFDHGYDNNTVIELRFSDDTTVKVINLHQFMDDTVNKFVTIDAQTVAQYVGHEFVKQDGNGYKTVELVGYEISEQYIEAYGIISAVHYNILVNGMLSTDFKEADYGLFNYFAIGDDMKFDQAAMAEDIANYGLYTYDEFSDYLTYEQFAAFNVPYFKIAVGKGQYTFADILNLIETYLN